MLTPGANPTGSEEEPSKITKSLPEMSSRERTLTTHESRGRTRTSKRMKRRGHQLSTREREPGENQNRDLQRPRREERSAGTRSHARQKDRWEKRDQLFQCVGGSLLLLIHVQVFECELLSVEGSITGGKFQSNGKGPLSFYASLLLDREPMPYGRL